MGRKQGRRCLFRVALLAMFAASGAPARAESVRPFEVVGDTVLHPLADRPGNAEHGRTVVVSRELGNCLVCHRMPIPEERVQGDVGPDLSAVGARLSAGQIRLRIADESRVNPETVMPPYYRAEGLHRVMDAYRGKPILTAQQIEDAVAFLLTLR